MENKEVAFMKDGELHITQEGRQALNQGLPKNWAKNIMSRIIGWDLPEIKKDEF